MSGRRRSLIDLPEDAIEKILCCLPIKEAARTSVLSRCWRRHWLSIRDLNLSDLSRSQIYQILSLHSGPLRFFKIQEPDSDDDDISESEPELWETIDVERWLTALSLHSSSSLRILILNLTSLEWDDLNLIRRCFPSLGSLHLSGYFSVPKDFQGFTSLNVLYITKIRPKENANDLSRLISACPLLEVLNFLKEDDDILPKISLDVTAPNLQVLFLNGLRLSDFTITSAPLLALVRMYDINYPFEGENHDNGGGNGIGDCRMVKVFAGMATIKELEMDNSILEFLRTGYVPERIPICFNNLWIVCLMDINFGLEKPMLVLRCLLRSCPSLRELEMDWGYYSSKPVADHDVWNFEGEEDIHLFNNLEAVTMTRMMCTRHELDFIKFILARAKVLKTVEISFNEKVKDRDSIVADLLEFPRVSKQARIMLSRSSLLRAKIREMHEEMQGTREKLEEMQGELQEIESKMQAQFDVLH